MLFDNFNKGNYIFVNGEHSQYQFDIRHTVEKKTDTKNNLIISELTAGAVKHGSSSVCRRGVMMLSVTRNA